MKGECQVTDTPGGRPRGFGCCKNHQQRHEPFPSCNGANSEQHSKPFAKQDAWYLASSKQHRFPKRTPNPTNINHFWMVIAVRLQGADQPTWGQTGRQMLRATAVSRLGVLFSVANAMRCTHGATNLWRNLSVDAWRPIGAFYQGTVHCSIA